MRLKYWQDVQQKLAGIQRAQLSAAEQVNYDVYRAQIAVLVANQRFRDFEMPANSDTTFWTDIGYTARRPFRTLEDYRHWIAQMQDIPRYFREQMDEMRAGLKRGFTPPRVTMQGRDASVTAVTEADAGGDPVLHALQSRCRACPRTARRLKAAARAIREVVQPAYAELLNFMRNEYVPGMRTTLAAAGRCRTARPTTAPRSASSRPSTWTRRRSTSSASRRCSGCTRQMLGAMQETGFKGDFPAFLKFLRPTRASTRRPRRSC